MTTVYVNALRENAADLAHQQWAGWMRYLFSKCHELPDGSLVIPPGCVARWARQMATEYCDLPDGEKESDRLEADRILALFQTTAGEKQA